MAFADLREQVSEQLQSAWNRAQENPRIAQLIERYQSLSPTTQKVVALSVAGSIALIIFLIPWMFFSASQELILEYDDSRDLITQLQRARREQTEIGLAPRKIEEAELIRILDERVMRANLAPEQRKGVTAFDNKAQNPSSVIPKNVIQTGVAVSLAKLNLTQIVRIGNDLLESAAGLKMVGLEAKASTDDTRYYDVTYKLVHFSMPEPPAPKEARRGSRPRPTPSSNEDNP